MIKFFCVLPGATQEVLMQTTNWFEAPNLARKMGAAKLFYTAPNGAKHELQLLETALKPV